MLIAENKPEAALKVAERGRARALVALLQQRFSETNSSPLNLAQLQQTAQAENATLVEYSEIYNSRNRNLEELYIWGIQPSGKITFRRVEVAGLLPKQCSSLSNYIKASRAELAFNDRASRDIELQSNAAPNSCLPDSDPTQKLKTLHKILTDPIADLLPSDPNQHVIFIPQDSLFLVPFAALQDANGKYLIEQHTIRTSSSIQLLDQTRALKAQAKGTQPLIIGNPTMPIGPGTTQSLPSLPGSETEAKDIAALYHTQALTGSQATKEAVKKQLSTAGLIHFGTHGLFNDRDGLKSAIALAPTQDDKDSFLTAEEIAKMHLQADLVVLSACETGNGKITGDGVVGLSRSFIAAGVPSVIVSLGAIPDTSTSTLMSEFYVQLQHHPDKAQALRQAMLKTMKTNPQPKDWAAFTLIGEP